jgi:hypothetical protein
MPVRDFQHCIIMQPSHAFVHLAAKGDNFAFWPAEMVGDRR